MIEPDTIEFKGVETDVLTTRPKSRDAMRIISLELVFQCPEKTKSKKDYFPEAGFDVFPAVSGRRAAVHD